MSLPIPDKFLNMHSHAYQRGVEYAETLEDIERDVRYEAYLGIEDEAEELITFYQKRASAYWHIIDTLEQELCCARQ